ncbi:MAG: hypothetical protein ACRECV_02565 [Xanthobacteraceae bacterium]
MQVGNLAFNYRHGEGNASAFGRALFPWSICGALLPELAARPIGAATQHRLGFRDGVPQDFRNKGGAAPHLPPYHLPKYAAVMQQCFASPMFWASRKMF